MKKIFIPALIFSMLMVPSLVSAPSHIVAPDPLMMPEQASDVATVQISGILDQLTERWNNFIASIDNPSPPLPSEASDTAMNTTQDVLSRIQSFFSNLFGGI